MRVVWPSNGELSSVMTDMTQTKTEKPRHVALQRMVSWYALFKWGKETLWDERNNVGRVVMIPLWPYVVTVSLTTAVFMAIDDLTTRTI